MRRELEFVAEMGRGPAALCGAAEWRWLSCYPRRRDRLDDAWSSVEAPRSGNTKLARSNRGAIRDANEMDTGMRGAKIRDKEVGAA
ncbi:hypothetical protein BHM03_00049683 [Ensete ventricosum]|nr:hypothetical protein BHM03_00049683 [Ensete ventricosum]